MRHAKSQLPLLLEKKQEIEFMEVSIIHLLVFLPIKQLPMLHSPDTFIRKQDQNVPKHD